jgi:GNAT superfamily N-acetyltransferase
MSTIRIAALTPADHTAWRPLWAGYQTFYKVDLPPQVTEAVWARMLDPAEPVEGALAWDGDRAVGLVQTVRHRSTWSVGDTCYLNDLFVLPEVRQQGVGRKLIEHVYARAAEAGCESVYWHTHETNVTAQQLYNRVAQRTGFIQYKKPIP